VAVFPSTSGRTVTGRGFGIPLVLRYVLETATSVRAAVAILQRLPVHMAYTVALVDRHGRHATVFVAPDRGAEVVRRLVSTNHQRRVEWPRHALATSSVERAAAIEAAMRARPSLGEIVSTFLRPPVFQTGYQRGYGTLYTAIYRPSLAAAELVWPTARWVQTCGAFAEGTRMISFDVAPAAGGTGDILTSPPACGREGAWRGEHQERQIRPPHRGLNWASTERGVRPCHPSASPIGSWPG
jgi:hypothetical protein